MRTQACEAPQGAAPACALADALVPEMSWPVACCHPDQVKANAPWNSDANKIYLAHCFTLRFGLSHFPHTFHQTRSRLRQYRLRGFPEGRSG